MVIIKKHAELDLGLIKKRDLTFLVVNKIDWLQNAVKLKENAALAAGNILYIII